MKVLVACEFSGIVREAFRARGHFAYSCDLLPAEDGSPYHLQGDVLKMLRTRPFHDWDLMIAHPPCTFLANSSNRWLYGGKGTRRDPQRWSDMERASVFFRRLLEVKIPRIAVENPVQHKHARALIGQRWTQTIQPWQFGHRELKRTCLWLRGLPLLRDTENVGPPPKDPVERRKWARVHQESPGPNRWMNRSRTLQGIAAAMADQWGGTIHG